MTGITREKASQVAASFLGGESRYLGTYYKTYAATDSQSREWKFTFDGSIVPEKKENGQKVTADAAYKTELVSPTGCAGASRVFVRFAYFHFWETLARRPRFSNWHKPRLPDCPFSLSSEWNERSRDLPGAQLPRWGYCKPTDERFLRELNRKRPQTMQVFQKIWYGGPDGSLEHYHASRYHALNLHSVFSKGTVEFRLFNSTVEHAGKIKADIQLCLAVCAQALNQRAASHTKTQTTNPAYTFRTWLLRMGMIGDEFATARKHLLENLEGNLAWRDPAQLQKQRERMRLAALERLPQPPPSPPEIEEESNNEHGEYQSFTMQM